MMRNRILCTLVLIASVAAFGLFNWNYYKKKDTLGPVINMDSSDIVVSVNNKEVETEDLKYLSTSDEIKVTLKWKTDKESKKALKEFERENKVRFKTSTDSYSVSLKEVAKKQMVD